MLMKKADILASLTIGLACGLILPRVTLFTGILPGQVLRYFPVSLPVLSLLGVWILETVFKTTRSLIQFGKSFLVGILNSAIDMGAFDCLVWFSAAAHGWLPVLFKTISFSFGAVNSYFWNKFWTFQKDDTENKAKEAAQFFLITIGGLLIHSMVIYIMINVIGVSFGTNERMWASISNMAAIFIGFAWNFLGYKFIVFKK
jgi:putative flippase GtrA